MNATEARVPWWKATARTVYRAGLAKLSERSRINASFLRYHHRLPDLDDPKTFSELVQWRKLNGLAADPLFSLYADKVKVKEIVARDLGPEWVTPTLWHGNALPDVLDWPIPYVVKANHASGRNYFVRTPSDLNEMALRSLAVDWMRSAHHPHLIEKHYDGIDPQLLVEPLIGANGVSPDDYKLFVFGGQVEFIQVDVGRFSTHRRAMLDRNWTLLPFEFEYPAPVDIVRRPASLERMIEAAETLGKPFDFARIDFYDLDGEPRFGEVTFAPESGYGRFRPRVMDEVVGRHWLAHLEPRKATKSPASGKSAPRIALHIGDLRVGGAERVCLTVAEHLARRGYDVDVVLSKTRGQLIKDIPAGVSTIDLRTRGSSTSLPALIRYMRSRRPVAMIASLVPQNTMAVLATVFVSAPTKVFVTQHAALSAEARGGWGPWRRLAPLLYRIVLPKASGVITVSRGVAQDLERVTGFPAARVEVIYNPIETAVIAEKSREPIVDPFFDTEAPIVLGVGRLTQQKSFDVLIDAFAHLEPDRGCRLAICGGGPLRKALTAQIIRLGLEDRVKLLGVQDNPFKYMAASKLLVLSSEREGFGNVLVEAMACGTPVLSTDGPHGPAEILDGGRFGELTPVGDVTALAAAIARTLDNPLPKEMLIARAREFSAEKAVDRYLDVIGLPHVAPGFEPKIERADPSNA